MHQCCVFCAVGKDFTTLTGEDVIAVEFNKGGETGFVNILLNEDLLDVDGKCFTADLEFQSEQSGCAPPMSNPFTTRICIPDRRTVICTFLEPEYYVYESAGYITLWLNSSRPVPLEISVYVDTIYGIGNASGE